MVRGNEKCPKFCKHCKKDCYCEAPGCNKCHNCRDNGFYNGIHISSLCRSYTHACITDKEEKRRRGILELQLEAEKEKKVSNMLGFPKLFDSEIVKINIGGSAEAAVRYVPKNALADNSEYFKSSFAFQEKSGGVSEAAGTTVLSLDTDVDRPGAFDCFIQFAYWRDYHPSSEKTDQDITLHADVYVLAERLQALKLKDLALRKATQIAVQFNKSVSAGSQLTYILDIIRTVYSNTPSPPNPPEEETDDAISSSDSASVDAFRTLISTLSATCLNKLKTHPGFPECVRMFPDFALDILQHVQNGKAMESDDQGYLRV